MPVNPFFNHTSFATEQKLIDDLIVESIQIYGHSVYYLRRSSVDMDHLFGEDILSRYTNATEIEMYLKSHTAFGGQGDFISKFGLHIEDQATFLVSRSRFLATFGTRPLEGDIIYVKMDETHQNDYLFDIRYVQDTEQLFQLGRLYTYELQCEMLVYSHERVETGIDEVDENAQRDAYTINLALGAGSGTYTTGETVYQGSTFLTATATGMVINANSSMLSVQNVTGAFSDGVNVVGVTSNASYVVGAPVNTAPTAHDPVSDNEQITTEAGSVIVSRGNNPRYRG